MSVLRATILLLNRSRAEQNHQREDREEGDRERGDREVVHHQDVGS